jgi:hypothetical protein
MVSIRIGGSKSRSTIPKNTLQKTVPKNALKNLRFQAVWALWSSLQKTVVVVAELIPHQANSADELLSLGEGMFKRLFSLIYLCLGCRVEFYNSYCPFLSQGFLHIS